MQQLNYSPRPTTATVNLDALERNYRSSRAFVGDNVAVMAVVKADAYGHGAVRCAKRLEDAGVDWLGVALVEEGAELRDAGLKTPILCLGGCWPGQADAMLGMNLTPLIIEPESAGRINDAAKARGTVTAVHVKIDTGMGRVGIPFGELSDFLAGFGEFKNLRVEGIMTHFAAADDLEQIPFTQSQMDKFASAVSMFKAAGHEPSILDLANSPGAVVHAGARSGMVRLGGILYGLGGDVLPAGVEKPDLLPVMSLTTQIAQIKKVAAGETLGYGRTFTTTRESTVATIGIGYHDGLPRALSNSGSVIVRGVKAPIVGRISMDWTIVDVTDVPAARRGDTVTIIGRDGAEQVLAEDIAALAGTISYEVTCGISRRVERRFIG